MRYNEIIEDKSNDWFSEIPEQSDSELFGEKPTGRYWHNTPEEYKRYWDQLVPDSGHSATVQGELLRAANKIYYDYYNNGFGNNWSGALKFIQQTIGQVPGLSTVAPFAAGKMPRGEEQEKAIEIALDQMMDNVMRAIRSANGEHQPNDTDMYSLSDKRQWDDEEDDGEDWRGEWEDDEEDDDVYENTEPSDDDLFGSEHDRRQQLANRIRERLAELQDPEDEDDEMEPEDAYEQVADEMDIDIEDLYDILNDDSLLEDEATDDELFGARKMYYVNIMGNWNSGRYSDYGARRYIVPGSSPESVIKWLVHNEDMVYAYLDGQKFPNGKRVVRRPARSNVFLDNSSVFGEAPAGSNSAIENFIRKHRAV